MTTYLQTQFLSELDAGHTGPPIPLEKRAYFQSRLRNRLFDFVLGKFQEQQRKGLTKAILARRIGKTPDVISRLLGTPGNWTLDTVSDLLIGIGAEELDPISARSLLNREPKNYRPSDNIGGLATPKWVAEKQAKAGDQSPPRQFGPPRVEPEAGLKLPFGQ